MKNKRKHFIKKVTAIVTMACMLTCSSSSAVIIPVIAGEKQESLKDLQDPTDEKMQTELQTGETGADLLLEDKAGQTDQMGSVEQKQRVAGSLKADEPEKVGNPGEKPDMLPEEGSGDSILEPTPAEKQTTDKTEKQTTDKTEEQTTDKTEEQITDKTEEQTGNMEQQGAVRQPESPEGEEAPEVSASPEPSISPSPSADPEIQEKDPDAEKDKQAEEKDGKKTVLTAQTNGVEFTLTAGQDAFPTEGELTLSVEEITDERLEKAKAIIEEKMLDDTVGLSSYRLFDVTPLLDGTEVQPEQPVKITFKNLELDEGSGQSIDVRKELEETGRILTEEGTDDPEAMAAVLDVPDQEENVVLYHFMDEETPEKLRAAAGKEEIVTQWNHFSWFFAGGITQKGEDYTWNFESEGGKYTLEYILSNYNVFTSGDYLGSHVVGPMVVGGEARGDGFGGYSHALPGETGVRNYPHQAPSYFEGYIHMTHNRKLVPNLQLGRSDLPVYLGRYNFEKDAGREKNFQQNNPFKYYLTPKKAYSGAATCDYSYMYVDFDKVFPSSPKVPERNLNPPGYADVKRPVGQHDYGYKGRYSWLNGEKDGKVQVSNDGILYGTDKTPGSILYYQNFEGFDSSRKYVSKVNVTEQQIQEVLDISNGLTNRTHGYSLYFDENGNRVDALEDKTIAQAERVPNSKDMYAFFISTKDIPIRADETHRKVNVGFRLGHNFTFESFDRMEKLIYDYDSEKEMNERLTIIQTMDSKERLVFPEINKISSDDGYGSTNEFGSIEGNKKCSVLFFAPHVEQVYVGYKSDTMTGGPGLTGHLVVPQADVWLAGGNFNGCVIGRNVDARGTEGHMWPFASCAVSTGIHVEGEKRVDGCLPGAGETFQFEAVVEEIATGKQWKMKADSGTLGRFQFVMDDAELSLGQKYRITIREAKMTEEQEKKYIRDTSVYVGDFQVELDKQDRREPLNIQWTKYPDEESKEAGKGGCSVTITMGEPVVLFNNSTGESFHLSKKWKNEDGTEIPDGAGCPPVTVNLYRTVEKTPGYGVKVKIYSGSDSGVGKDYHLIDEVYLGETAKGSPLSLRVECIDKMSYVGEVPTAGVAKVRINNISYHGDTSGYDKAPYVNLPGGTHIHLSSVDEEVTIQVYFEKFSSVTFGNLLDPAQYLTIPTKDMFKTTVQEMSKTDPVFEPLEEHFLDSKVLSKDNNWNLIWNNLQACDSNGKKYFYKVVEADGNYSPEYENQTVSLDGLKVVPEVTITNTRRKALDTNLWLKKTDKDNGMLLSGAEFRLTNYDTGNQLYFIKKAEGVYEYDAGMSAGSQSVVSTSADSANEGSWEIRKLPFGKYVLEETVSPAGYAREEQKLEFQINEDGSAVILNSVTPEFARIIKSDELGMELSFTNQAGVELPGTGGTGADGFRFAGVSLIGTADRKSVV